MIWYISEVILLRAMNLHHILVLYSYKWMEVLFNFVENLVVDYVDTVVNLILKYFIPTVTAAPFVNSG